MVQADGMVLEGGMTIGHGRVAGIAGFGEEAEIRETQALDQLRTGLPAQGCTASLGLGMDEHAPEQEHQSADQAQTQG